MCWCCWLWVRALLSTSRVASQRHDRWANLFLSLVRLEVLRPGRSLLTAGHNLDEGLLPVRPSTGARFSGSFTSPGPSTPRIRCMHVPVSRGLRTETEVSDWMPMYDHVMCDTQ